MDYSRHQVLNSLVFTKPAYLNVYVLPPDSVEAVLEAVRRRWGNFEVVYSLNNYFKLELKQHLRQKQEGAVEERS